MIRTAAIGFVYVSLLIEFSLPGACQTGAVLEDYFKNSIGLSQGQIADIRGGTAIGKVLPSRIPDEIFVFGAVYINAPPESYLRFVTDFDRLRKLREFVAIRKFSDPPQVADLEGFTFDGDDIKALKECKPRHCDVQLPEQAMENIRQSINWDAPDLDRQVNQLLQQRAIERLQEYHREGNEALGTYQDKDHPTDVQKQFEYMLSYTRVLPQYLPDFHRYLLAYPNANRQT